MPAKHPTRRSALNLPSRRKHLALATLVLIGGLLLPVATVLLFGNPTDARAEGSVLVAKLPTMAILSPLEDESLATPDLLAGDVPEGVNPTDALVSSNSDMDAVGDSVSKSNEPKTITIPIDQRRALRSAPIPGLTRQSSFGPVPNKGASNAMAAYKRPYTQKTGKRPVSLIIGGLGVHRRLTQDAIKALPADVTLSFAAHSVGLQDWIDMARADGHEVLIEIPMESEGFDPSEPGADRALRVSTSEREMKRNLDWILSRAQGYAGVINFNGDLFLRRTDVAAPFIDQLSKTGLGFITDGSFQTPSLSALSRSVGQPFKTGNGLIDPDPIPQVISARLGDLTKAASTETHPVGVGFYYQETLSEVTRWIATLESEGLQLAPATASLK